jgi:hypothetical protein
MQGKYIVWIVILVILIMSGLAYWTQSNTSGEVSPKIIKELIEPYTELIKNNNYEEAYFSFTSSDYRAKTTLAQYTRAQDSNFTHYGELVDIKPVSGVFLKETAKGNKIIFKATFGYIGSNKSQRIMLDAIREDGKYKLYNTYNSYVSIGGLMPVIY